MVTGDAATCREARALLGDGLTTVVTKQGLGRYSARHVAPARARASIEAAAAQALADPGAVAPYDPGRPCEIEVELAVVEDAEELRTRHGVELKDTRTVIARADDWWAAWRNLYL